MLNALRHQRFWQRLPSTLRLPPPPVLNALRHQRFWQRIIVKQFNHSLSVLNALRHQRFWQRPHSTADWVFFPVLNALRHQRFWQCVRPTDVTISDCAQRLAASEVLAVNRKKLTSMTMHKCSTPCGIRGFGRSFLKRLFLVFFVLNALRHQRFWQYPRNSNY